MERVNNIANNAISIFSTHDITHNIHIPTIIVLVLSLLVFYGRKKGNCEKAKRMKSAAI